MHDPLEAVLLDLERELAYTAWVIRHQRMTPREAAIYHNGLAIASRTAESFHKAQAERDRRERIEEWRRRKGKRARS